MDTKISGKIWRFPDDVDTDTIIPGRYGVLPTVKDMSLHCMEPLGPEFASLARPGDIIVAGKNFGCGSSREQAPACIKALGINCIIAKSFARIFYRNGINNGMILIESKEAPDKLAEGDIITVEVNRRIICNTQEFIIPAFPDNVFEIIKAGGLVNSYRTKNERNSRGSE